MIVSLNISEYARHYICGDNVAEISDWQFAIINS
jgi:hypothetical protein